MSQLASGRSTNCDTACAGGLADDVYLANAGDVTSYQTDVDGKCTGITMNGAAVFYQFGYDDFTAKFTENVNVNEDNGNVTVEQLIEMVWGCRNHPDRNSIMTLATNKCGMLAIHAENTGTYWLSGYLNKKRWKLQTSVGESGAKLEDTNAETLTLRCLTTEKAIEFTPGQGGIPL